MYLFIERRANHTDKVELECRRPRRLRSGNHRNYAYRHKHVVT